MSLLAQIEKDYEQAFKNKQESAVSTLRLLLAALKNEKIKKMADLEEEDIIKVIKAEIKKRKEAIEAYEKADRMELAAGENEEKDILEKYLPAQMSEEDIRKKVKQIIEGLDDKDNLGKAMGVVMAELKNQADGTVVRKIVEEEMKK